MSVGYRFGVRQFAFLFLGMTACSAGDRPSDEGRDRSMGVVQKTISTAHQTGVAVTTIPNAECKLTNEDNAGALSLTSDENGEVYFYAQAPANDPSSTTYSFSCQDANGGIGVQTVVLQGSDSPDVADSPRTPRAGTTRPALAGDPDLYTQEELTIAGYPIRPDPKQNEGAYSAWRQLVSHSVILLDHGVAMPDVHMDISANWAGFQTLGDPTFEVAYAYWWVPSLQNQCPESPFVADSALWVGLDGSWSSADVIQTGTEQEISVNTRCQLAYSYRAWVEYYPASQLFVFNVNPGDEMYGEAWASDAFGNVNPSGGYGWFYIEDMTIGYAYFNGIQKPSSAPNFAGGTAEWILEDPGGGQLADFGTAWMAGAGYVNTSAGEQWFDALPNANIEIYDGEALANANDLAGEHEIAFVWDNY